MIVRTIEKSEFFLFLSVSAGSYRIPRLYA